MKGFLSAYMAHRRNPTGQVQDQFRDVFEKTTDLILKAIGPKAFKPKAALNAALVDALMVGVARRIKANGDKIAAASLKSAYGDLLRNSSFQDAIGRATADEENVKFRLRFATTAIRKVK
jgi:hypothetical protein